jgi:Holliday junction resolvase
MTNYAKGAKYERKLGELLEREGYFVVRAAGSHSAVDLVAVGESNIKLIQVKSSRRKIVGIESVETSFGKDITNLCRIKCPPTTKKELWLWTFREGWRTFSITEDGVVREMKK